MINMIKKECTNETIIYERIDNEVVNKCHFDINGVKKKEKQINVRMVHQNRRSHRNVEDFFEDMIFNYGYHELCTVGRNQ